MDSKRQTRHAVILHAYCDLDGSPCRPAINLVQSMMRAMRAIGPSGLSGLADMKLPALAQRIH